jgi:membrane-associated protease RseP (regulator of RpoE activity)
LRPLASAAARAALAFPGDPAFRRPAGEGERDLPLFFSQTERSEEKAMSTTATGRALTALAAVLPLAAATAAIAADVRPRPIPDYRGEWVVEVTAVEPRGPADRAGLEVRDRILEVNGVRVTSLAQLRRLLNAADDSARLTVVNWRTARETTVYVYPEGGRIGIDARMVLAYPPRRYPY